MSWEVLALLGSLLTAAAAEVNHRYKVEGLLLSFLSAIFAVVLFFPLLFFIPWPTAWEFYALCIFIGSIIVYSDKETLNVSAQYGSRMMGMMPALTFILTFIFWTAIDPESITSLWEDQSIFWGIVVCISLSLGGVFMMRRNGFCWQALNLLFVPAIVLSTILASAKLSMGYVEGFSGVFIYTWVLCVSTAVTAFPFVIRAYKRGDYQQIPVHNIKMATLILGLVWAIHPGIIAWAMHLAPNPAYVQTINMVNIVWLMVYHKIRKQPDHLSPWAGLMMVLGAAGIALLIS